MLFSFLELHLTFYICKFALVNSYFFLSGYSWQELILSLNSKITPIRLWDHMGCWELNTGWLHAMSYLLC